MERLRRLVDMFNTYCQTDRFILRITTNHTKIGNFFNINLKLYDTKDNDKTLITEFTIKGTDENECIPKAEQRLFGFLVNFAISNSYVEQISN